MDLVSILVIAAALAMDAFAAAIGLGCAGCDHNLRLSLKTALCFGFFQALMPVLGWLSGTRFQDVIQALDHWIAFVILGLIGLKMIWEAFHLKGRRWLNPNSWMVLLSLSVATSIDALAAGITFAFLKTGIVKPVILIGLTTAILSFVGVYLGSRFRPGYRKLVEIAGGTILIIIGFKILLEHLLLHR